MNRTNVVMVLIVCLLVSLCSSQAFAETSGLYTPNTGAIGNGTSDKYSFLDEVSEEDAQLVMATIVSIQENQSPTTKWEHYGYDIDREDVETYVLAISALGRESDALSISKHIGYHIDDMLMKKAQNYAEAKQLVKEGNYLEALQKFHVYPDYLDSSVLCEEMINQGLVVFKVGKIGPAGGWVFYDKGYYSDGWRYLEAAPADLYGYCVWGPDSGKLGTATGIGTGKSNTDKIPAEWNGYLTAAQACREYSVNGYDDWFLPSKDELNTMYRNLKANRIGSLSDSHSDSNYWSSSEYSWFDAWGQYFYDGTQYYDGRGYGGRVRPVRAF